MPGQTCSCEDVAALVFAVGDVVLVFIGLLVVLLTLAATATTTLAESNVGISIEYTTGLIDVATGVIAFVIVGTNL